MTLQQLSYQYQEQARVLHQRIVDLRRAQAQCESRESEEHLRQRIRDLEPLHRESRQLAGLPVQRLQVPDALAQMLLALPTLALGLGPAQIHDPLVQHPGLLLILVR